VLAVLVGVGLIAPVFVLARGMRPDLAFLPTPWVVLMAVFWAAGALLPLLTAVVPPRGEVLPDTARAGRFALAAAVILLVLGLFTTVSAPGHTVMPTQAFDGAWQHCIRFGLAVTVPVLLVSLLVMRQSLPVGGVSVAAALGAGAGALAGLTLHFVCPIGDGVHVGLAHAGGVIVGALLGVVTLPRFIQS
ncbi:MAG TPA: NrsF family protein, partial [Polyangia bacterium]|nr:NrsF family protein [Polyangia bacterium]